MTLEYDRTILSRNVGCMSLSNARNTRKNEDLERKVLDSQKSVCEIIIIIIIIMFLKG